MDNLTDLLDIFFDYLLYEAVMPFLNVISFVLDGLILPLKGLSPAMQISAVAVVAVIISILLEKKVKNPSGKKLQKQLNEKIKSLKYTKELNDPEKELILRKGINDSADIIYEELVIDRFYSLGITYFFPMMFFLIWLDYSHFSSDKLVAMTGNPFVVKLSSGLTLDTAFYYICSFNLLLIIYKLFEYSLPKIYKFVFRPVL